MDISFALILKSIDETSVLSKEEKEESRKLYEFVESDPPIEEWRRMFTKIKCRAEYFWSKLEYDSDMLELEVQKVIADKQLYISKMLSDNGVKTTESNISNALNGDADIIKLRAHKLEMKKVLGYFKSLSFNIAKDLLVQDSMSAREEQKRDGLH